MATGCTFRVSTTGPDGNREDKPLDDLLEESEQIQELTQNETWDEVERSVETVEVTSDDGSATVTIERMTSVTFELFESTQEPKKRMTLNFNNP